MTSAAGENRNQPSDSLEKEATQAQWVSASSGNQKQSSLGKAGSKTRADSPKTHSLPEEACKQLASITESIAMIAEKTQ